MSSSTNGSNILITIFHVSLFYKFFRHSNDFFHEAKWRQKILCLILIVSTNKVNMFKIRALPVFG